MGAGEPAFRGRQLREWLYSNPVLHTRDMTNLPIGLRRALADRLWPFEVEQHQVADRRATYKWLFRMPDGAAIEAVAMGYGSRTTLCVSSQAGCALACTFCATGQFGFERHLQAGEILAQLPMQTHSCVHLFGMLPQVTNCGVMGMGRPLANYPRLREAIRLMVEEVGMSPRSLNGVNFGVVPESADSLTIVARQTGCGFTLRRRPAVAMVYVPPWPRWRRPAAYFFRKERRRISLSWTMIRDVNEISPKPRDWRPLPVVSCPVNLIALNPTPLSADRPSTSEVNAGSRNSHPGLNVTVRDTRGTQIYPHAASCELRGSSGKGEGPARAESSSSPGRPFYWAGIGSGNGNHPNWRRSRPDERLTNRNSQTPAGSSSDSDGPLAGSTVARGKANLTYLLRYGERRPVTEYVLRVTAGAGGSRFTRHGA